MKRTHRGLSVDSGAPAEGKPARVRPPLALFVSAVAIALSACTMVRVGEGSAVRTRYYPGLAVIRITPTDSVQVVEARSLGVSSVGDATTLGWSHSRVALVPPGRCQLILWRAERGKIDELRGLIGPRTESCAREGEGP
jgi:hypothetical protein